jgi:hypothetical protein
MEYKVVSIVPVQKDKENIQHIAQELENLINKYNADGWEYIRVENLMTWVNPVNGCFGLGATAGYYSQQQMVVFRK